MTSSDRWLLPDGVEEILPPQARNLELLRRDILDLYGSWGYDLVLTPLIEFLDSLLIVPSNKLQLRTFKIVDQITGRSMGVRADITAQVARIDAHVLKHDGPTRLCYADSVLHTKPSTTLGSRSPIRIGAELYGHAGTDSDVEVISLMLETLSCAGLGDVQLALGHVDIYRHLADLAGLDSTSERKLFKALQRKSGNEVNSILEEGMVEDSLADMIRSLLTLYGDISILDQAEKVLADAPAATITAISRLRDIAKVITERYPQQNLYFDLAELRGYEYHTGVVFASYVEGYGEALSKGGRYDHIGEVFGRARPATGFDTDLKTLFALSTRKFAQPDKVLAPASSDPQLQDQIKRLRESGAQVITQLEGQQQTAKDMGCSHELVQESGQWACQTV